MIDKNKWKEAMDDLFLEFKFCFDFTFRTWNLWNMFSFFNPSVFGEQQVWPDGA